MLPQPCGPVSPQMSVSPKRTRKLQAEWLSGKQWLHRLQVSLPLPELSMQPMLLCLLQVSALPPLYRSVNPGLRLYRRLRDRNSGSSRS